VQKKELTELEEIDDVDKIEDHLFADIEETKELDAVPKPFMGGKFMWHRFIKYVTSSSRSSSSTKGCGVASSRMSLLVVVAMVLVLVLFQRL
jgi:hypothetical protein